MIPVSVIIVTKNESKNIKTCLDALRAFDDIWVVDSDSRDGTADLARDAGAQVVEFQWNGAYPKKRGWCLENLSLKHDWVFFVDADEIVPDDLVQEIDALIKTNTPEAGFFMTGRYVMNGKILKFGLPNNKIVLLNRRFMEFPVVDDLDIPGMGEIEGHYQPVLKENHLKIGQLKNFMIHDALDDAWEWAFRHEKYARWEAGMNTKNAWPVDPVSWRQTVKSCLRKSRFRPEIVFCVSYILKGGFLDGRAGLDLAKRKYGYYKKINYLLSSNRNEQSTL